MLHTNSLHTKALKASGFDSYADLHAGQSQW